MLKRTITFPDFIGGIRTEDFYFNLTTAEILEWEMSVDGGMTSMIQRISQADSKPELIKLFKEFIDRCYGVRTADGRGFEKSEEHLRAFKSTEAYSMLFMELATDDKKAADFINGVAPRDMREKVAAEIAKRKDEIDKAEPPVIGITE